MIRLLIVNLHGVATVLTVAPVLKKKSSSTPTSSTGTSEHYKTPDPATPTNSSGTPAAAKPAAKITAPEKSSGSKIGDPSIALKPAKHANSKVVESLRQKAAAVTPKGPGMEELTKKYEKLDKKSEHLYEASNHLESAREAWDYDRDHPEIKEQLENPYVDGLKSARMRVYDNRIAKAEEHFTQATGQRQKMFEGRWRNDDLAMKDVMQRYEISEKEKVDVSNSMKSTKAELDSMSSPQLTPKEKEVVDADSRVRKSENSMKLQSEAIKLARMSDNAHMLPKSHPVIKAQYERSAHVKNLATARQYAESSLRGAAQSKAEEAAGRKLSASPNPKMFMEKLKQDQDRYAMDFNESSKELDAAVEKLGK